MKKIQIRKNVLGDSRTATRVPTIEEFSVANRTHRSEVLDMMNNLAEELRSAGRNHDYTKTIDPTMSLFYRELCATIEGKMNFTSDGVWYKQHCEVERHHLNERCPEDVNLIDVLEMVCDCVCAGMARSGQFRPIEISDEILQKAVANTAEMCVGAVELIGGEAG